MADRNIQAQSALMSYSDGFIVIGLAFACALPLLLFFRGGRLKSVAGQGMH